ncbi:MAG TPA: DinB family protein [Candidatus Limnocylindria bacterium]|nr:DinB family protein [Candidatus Limnocylindria bacterium]
MGRTSLTVEQVLALLAATPTRIGAAAASLTPPQLRTRPARGEWSANEVLAHLRACADTRGDPIRTIIEEDRATFHAVNPLTWIERTDYLDREFGPSLRAFARQRADLLARLRALPPEGWSRSATVKQIERIAATMAARARRGRTDAGASVSRSRRAV